MTEPHTGAPVELEPDMTQALADLAELKELSLRFGYDLFSALASLAESNAPFILGEIDDAATARAGHAVARFKLAERLDGALMALRARNSNAHVGHDVFSEIKISQEMIDSGTAELDRNTGEALTLDHLVVRVFRAMCTAHRPLEIPTVDVSEYRERAEKG